MRWSHTPPPQQAVKRLQTQLGLSPVLAELLAHRVSEPEEARVFLDPRLRRLSDPFALTQLEAVVKRLCLALENGEEICIVGDYDVDGITSTALLVSALQAFGGKPVYYLPRRMEEGYGLSSGMLDRILAGAPPDLLIALDCGTNSADEVKRLRTLGIDVIVVDHHESKDAVATDCLLINPKLYAADAPLRDLCTAGLVFKLIHGLVKDLRQQGDKRAHELQLKGWLDLVALGTVADLVPLRGENRIFVREGLRQVSQTKRPGLKALCEISGLERGQQLSTADLSYKLGPRLNAGGRLADAAMPLELLLSQAAKACHETAVQLDALNRERQGIERRIFEEALHAVDRPSPDAVVVAGEDWHAGVVGIVAGRLARQFYRPAIVLCRDGDLYRGSGRSIAEVNLQEVLHDCDGYLAEWGGHRMAVGVSVEAGRLSAFQAAFTERVGQCFTEAIPEPTLDLAAKIKPEDLGESLLNDIDRLRPFGMDNPEPVFWVEGVVLPRAPEVFAQKHIKFDLLGERGRKISAIGWSFSEKPPPAGQPLDLAVRFGWNTWNGRRSPRLELVDWSG
ncbi:MAG: single-stranded-DNA-specific exonuclease RecJ [Verrucomicrobiota bacterium]